MPGQAGQPKFQLGDAVVVRELPALFYTRTPE
jgi:thiocyanate hydrolase subunit alpha/thiocyanate hydrolase subunit beta